MRHLNYYFICFHLFLKSKFQENVLVMFCTLVQDLIHGAPVGKPAANKASVTAVYADQVTEKETVFTRIIRGSSSDHKINGQVS